MRSIWALCCGTILLSSFCAQDSIAVAQQPSSEAPTIRVTSRLVYLDVTVLDKKKRPVVNGLTKDDFTITEDKKPQRIFSFEAPETHVVDANATDDDRSGKAPVTIFVLDVLNSSIEDFGYIRYMVHKYLAAQPAQLNSPAELMVLGNYSLDMVQGYTRNKADLLDALAHIPPVIPFAGDRFLSISRSAPADRIAKQRGARAQEHHMDRSRRPESIFCVSIFRRRYQSA